MWNNVQSFPLSLIFTSILKARRGLEKIGFRHRCAHAGDKQLQSQWSAEPIQPGKRAPLPTIYSVIMCNCDPLPSLSVAFELLSALRSPQTSPVGLTLAFPAQHFPATPTDGLFQLITAVPCMVEPSRLHTHHSCLCCHSQLSQLVLIKFQFFCIKETVRTKHDKCTEIPNPSVTTWQKSKDTDPVHKAKPTNRASGMHDLQMLLTLTSRGERAMLCFALYYSTDIAGGTDAFTLTLVKKIKGIMGMHIGLCTYIII